MVENTESTRQEKTKRNLQEVRDTQSVGQPWSVQPVSISLHASDSDLRGPSEHSGVGGYSLHLFPATQDYTITPIADQALQYTCIYTGFSKGSLS